MAVENILIAPEVNAQERPKCDAMQKIGPSSKPRRARQSRHHPFLEFAKHLRQSGSIQLRRRDFVEPVAYLDDEHRTLVVAIESIDQCTDKLAHRRDLLAVKLAANLLIEFIRQNQLLGETL